MGLSRPFLFSIFFIMMIFSCSIFNRGHFDQFGQYVPNNPHFDFKDKAENILPKNFSENSIYQLSEAFAQNIKIYPTDSNTELDRVINYIRFYPNGRCLFFSIPSKDKLGNINQLKEEDLNPNNQHSKKNYYYSSDGNNIEVESFVFGNGNGLYTKTRYNLDSSSITLTMNESSMRMIYKKIELEGNWKSFPVNW